MENAEDKKEISRFSLSIIGVWGCNLKTGGGDIHWKLFTSSSTFLILGNIRSLLIAKTNCQQLFVIIRTWLFKGAGIDTPLRRRLLHGMCGILYSYYFSVYHTIAQL